MQPMLPFLLGTQKHPMSNRVADSQKCVRTVDIEDVGDNRHLTFFEMLGNWSFGDYFKQDSITWSFEFLTDKKWLGLDPNRIYVTVYKGNGTDVPPDLESIKIWQDCFESVGIKADIGDEPDFSKLDKAKDFKLTRITKKSAKENWWDLPIYGPCGGDTEIFYLLDEYKVDFFEKNLLDLEVSELEDIYENKLIEIWNNVFIEYKGQRKSRDSEPENLQKLDSQSVDTGMGMERILAIINGYDTVYKTDLFVTILDVIDKYSKS